MVVYMVQIKSDDADAQWEPVVQSAAPTIRAALIRFGEHLAATHPGSQPAPSNIYRVREYFPLNEAPIDALKGVNNHAS